MTGSDALMAVALALHASDNADLPEPWDWADLDAKQERSYLKSAAGLIDSGLITWPPTTPAASLDPTVADHLAAVIHNDIDHQWPNWADLHEHARDRVRTNVRDLDAAGLLDHATAKELISAPDFLDRPDIWAEPRPISWAPAVPSDDPPF